MLTAVDAHFHKHRADLVLVQGDTTTVFIAALASFYHRIPLGHVEARLRTGDLQSPWPEEANRVMTSRLTRLHFAPTEFARENLVREGVPGESIFVTGNTVIDSLLWVRERLRKQPDTALKAISLLGFPEAFTRRFLFSGNNTDNPLILITGHRRESFGAGFENMCRAIVGLVEQHPRVGVIYPVHLNPNVQEPVQRLLGGHPRIRLLAPLEYQPFIWLMDKAYFVLSDSGGVQEEAPSLGQPVLVMRETTERPEGGAAGTCKLVGTDPAVILREASVLLNDAAEYQGSRRLKNPYGEGPASEKILWHGDDFLHSRRMVS